MRNRCLAAQREAGATRRSRVDRSADRCADWPCRGQSAAARTTLSAGDGVASLELGTAAETRLGTGYGTLPVVSAGGAADHRRHHARRGHQKDPLPSETCGRPAPHCSGACPPGSLLLVLCLTVSGGSPTRPRSRRLVDASSPRLVLRLRSPLTPPVGGEG